MALQPSEEPLLLVVGLSLTHDDFVLFPLRAGAGHRRRLPAEQPSNQASHSGDSVRGVGDEPVDLDDRAPKPQSRSVATDDTRVATTAHPHADDRRRLLSAWEGSPFGIAFLNADGHVVDSNEAMRSITGYDADELALMPVASYTHPDDNPESVANFRRLIAGETDSYRLETRLIQKDGGAVWVDSFVTARQDAPGASRTALSMVQDITSRKLAELALRDQNARLSRVVETQAEIAAADLELDGVSQLIAQRAQELTGADGAMVSILDGEELLTAAAIGNNAPAARISVPLLHRGRNVGSLSVAKEAGVTTRIAARWSCSQSSSPRR